MSNHAATVNQPDPGLIMQVGLGFWAAKTLLSAVELGVFTELAKKPATLQALSEKLSLHPRSAHDFLDAMVALGFLERASATYSNTLLPPISSSIKASPPILAEFWKWPMRDITAFGRT